MGFVGADDLVLGLLNRDQLSELGGSCELSLADSFGLRLEQPQDFVANMGVATEDPLARLRDHSTQQRAECLDLRLSPPQHRLGRRPGLAQRSPDSPQLLLQTAAESDSLGFPENQ